MYVGVFYLRVPSSGWVALKGHRRETNLISPVCVCGFQSTPGLLKGNQWNTPSFWDSQKNTSVFPAAQPVLDWFGR